MAAPPPPVERWPYGEGVVVHTVGGAARFAYSRRIRHHFQNCHVQSDRQMLFIGAFVLPTLAVIFAQVDATLAAGVDIVVWRDNQHNRKRPMRAAMREWTRRSLLPVVPGVGRVYLLLGSPHSKTYARVVFPDAAAKMVLVNRIIALQAGGVLAQTTPAQLLRGVLAFVQVGNVNLSRNTLGLWVALNMYGVNHCLFDCAWMFQGASGLMVVAAMLWEAGLCGRPPLLRVGPLMVMASNDVASTTVGFHALVTPLRAVRGGETVFFSFTSLAPFNGIDLVRELLLAFIRLGQGGVMVLLSDLDELVKGAFPAGGQPPVRHAIISIWTVVRALQLANPGVPFAQLRVGLNRNTGDLMHPTVLFYFPAPWRTLLPLYHPEAARCTMVGMTQAPGQGNFLGHHNKCWELHPGDPQWQGSLPYLDAITETNEVMWSGWGVENVQIFVQKQISTMALRAAIKAGRRAVHLAAVAREEMLLSTQLGQADDDIQLMARGASAELLEFHLSLEALSDELAQLGGDGEAPLGLAGEEEAEEPPY